MPLASLLQHVRVLVAHRDGAVRAAARGLLMRAGAEVTEADGAVEAAEAVRRGQPHVVLLEHGLDDAHDRSLVRDVAGDPELLGTAVILLRPGAGVDDVA